MELDTPITLKVAVVGDAGVGKTSLVHRFSDNTYTDQYKSTVGVDFKQRYITTNKDDGTNQSSVRVNIWDTAGQERFRSIVNSYYRDVDAVIVVYDSTNPQSFRSINRWIRDIRKNVNTDGIDIPIIISGAKSDLTRSDEIDEHSITELILSDKWFDNTAFMTSALQNINVFTLFEHTATLALRTYYQKKGQQMNEKLQLKRTSSDRESRSGTCVC